VERVVIQQDPQCLENPREASKLISATAAKLQESRVAPELSMHSGPVSAIEPFPTLDAMERAMIVAAYPNFSCLDEELDCCDAACVAGGGHPSSEDLTGGIAELYRYSEELSARLVALGPGSIVWS
jgi:hypothetical protein